MAPRSLWSGSITFGLVNAPVRIYSAFEYAKGKCVYMEEQDFAAAKVEGYKTIDVEAFVNYDEIDPIYFAKTYYVGPEEGGEHVYALPARAMKDSGLAAVTRFVRRDHVAEFEDRRASRPDDRVARERRACRKARPADDQEEQGLEPHREERAVAFDAERG
jgi:non-homologous end joining protein Ku